MESKMLQSLSFDPGYLFIAGFVLIVILFVLNVRLSLKYNRLRNSYQSFMKGKDGRTLEDSMKEKFSEADAIVKVTRQNRADVKNLAKNLDNNFQKSGIVKYDAFNEMGGKLSFALALLDGRNNGFVLNAMHSREGCYTYIKEIINAESFVELTEEEAEALDKAIFADIYESKTKVDTSK